MKKNLNSLKVVTGKTFAIHQHLFTPQSFNGSIPKYTLNFGIFKHDKETLEIIENAIEAAIEQGEFEKDETFNRELLRLPLRDGDLEYPNDPLYAGCYFMNATNTIKPTVVDKNVKEIYDGKKISLGDYVKVSISFVPYNFNNNQGVSCRLHGVQYLGLPSRLIELRADPTEDFVKEK